jgi:Sulfotransferase domain
MAKVTTPFYRVNKHGVLVQSRKPPATPELLWKKPLQATLFHITHWKAATTWISRVLRDAFGKRVLMPRAYFERYVSWPVVPNRIYPAACLTKEAFDALELPQNSRRVVVIRDLRDAVVSAYYSIRFSHGADPYVEKDRRILESLDQENGILYLIQTWALKSAAIQRSWLSVGEPFVRFEDITTNPTENFRKILLEHWGLKVKTAVLDQVLVRHQFSQYSGGRDKGTEDINSHYRKGTAGDWRLHFSDKTKTEFKRLFNDVLVLGGYEADDLW